VRHDLYAQTRRKCGDNSDSASSGGTSGYSGGESHSLTVETASVTDLVIRCTGVLKGV